MNDKEKYVLEHYEITKDGKVFSTYTNKYLKYRKDKDGYFDVTLIYNSEGKRMPFRVHRLIALKYISNPNNYKIVNHKDLNKQNNCLENLEWVNHKINTQHGYDNCAYSNIKKVKCVEPTGTIHIFPSISHASRFYNYANSTTIQAILAGRKNNPNPRGTRKGLYFEYTDESVTTIEKTAITVDGE